MMKGLIKIPTTYYRLCVKQCLVLCPPSHLSLRKGSSIKKDHVSMSWMETQSKTKTSFCNWSASMPEGSVVYLTSH